MIKGRHCCLKPECCLVTRGREECCFPVINASPEGSPVSKCDGHQLTDNISSLAHDSVLPPLLVGCKAHPMI